MIFANIEYLFLLLLLIPYIVWYFMRRKKTEPTMQVSTTRMYMNAPKTWKVYLLHAPFLLRVVSFVMIVLVLARPQTTDNWQNFSTCSSVASCERSVWSIKFASSCFVISRSSK